MPNPTTTVLAADLISILYVLLFRFQRWLSGDLTGFIPTGRSSPVVGGNSPIFTLSNAAQLARRICTIPLILLILKPRCRLYAKRYPLGHPIASATR